MFWFFIGLCGPVLELQIRKTAFQQGLTTSAYGGVEILARDCFASVFIGEPGVGPERDLRLEFAPASVKVI